MTTGKIPGSGPTPGVGGDIRESGSKATGQVKPSGQLEQYSLRRSGPPSTKAIANRFLPKLGTGRASGTWMRIGSETMRENPSLKDAERAMRNADRANGTQELRKMWRTVAAEFTQQFPETLRLMADDRDASKLGAQANRIAKEVLGNILRQHLPSPEPDPGNEPNDVPGPSQQQVSNEEHEPKLDADPNKPNQPVPQQPAPQQPAPPPEPQSSPSNNSLSASIVEDHFSAPVPDEPPAKEPVPNRPDPKKSVQNKSVSDRSVPKEPGPKIRPKGGKVRSNPSYKQMQQELQRRQNRLDGLLKKRDDMLAENKRREEILNAPFQENRNRIRKRAEVYLRPGSTEFKRAMQKAKLGPSIQKSKDFATAYRAKLDGKIEERLRFIQGATIPGKTLQRLAAQAAREAAEDVIAERQLKRLDNI